MRLPVLAIGTGILVTAGVLLVSFPPLDSESPKKSAIRNPSAASNSAGPSVRADNARILPPGLSRDPKVAILSLSKLPDDASRAILLRRIFSDRRRNIEELINLALRLPGERDRQAAFAAIYRSLLRPSRYRDQRLTTASQTPQIFKAIPGQQLSKAHLLADILQKTGASPVLIARLGAPSVSADSWVYALGAMSQLARQNPDAALALSRIGGEALRQGALNAIAIGWARTSPRTAEEWARTLPSSSERTRALGTIANSTVDLDVRYAASLLNSIPDSESRSIAISSIAERWSMVDTEAALNWARSLPSPSESQSALDVIHKMAPSGIGMTITRPGNSQYPTAGEIVPNSPAARSGSIPAGSQIVAVADQSGSWIGTEGRTVDQVAGLIRGESGSAVQMQILPPGATQTSQAQTVTIVRDQLMFKSPQPGLPN